MSMGNSYKFLDKKLNTWYNYKKRQVMSERRTVMNLSYEIVGSLVYLSVRFERGLGIDGMYLNIIKENEFSNMLKPVIRTEHEDVLISYNITSKTSLEQKTVMSTEEFKQFFESAVNVIKTVKNNGLAYASIMFDAGYIYTNSENNFEFICLPLKKGESNEDSLRRCVFSLANSNKIEESDFLDKFFKVIANKDIPVDEVLRKCGESHNFENDQDDKTVLLINPEEKKIPYLIYKGEKAEINKNRFIVGKNTQNCDFVISNNTVSRTHAEFSVEFGEVYIKDLNSTNGTYINRSGRRMGNYEKVKLSDGDVITLAKEELIFKNK